MSPDTRRTVRNWLLVFVVLGLLALLYWATELLSKDLLGIREIARGCLIIIGLFVIGVIAENVGRVSVDIAGAKADVGEGNGQT